ARTWARPNRSRNHPMQPARLRLAARLWAPSPCPQPRTPRMTPQPSHRSLARAKPRRAVVWSFTAAALRPAHGRLACWPRRFCFAVGAADQAWGDGAVLLGTPLPLREGEL